MRNKLAVVFCQIIKNDYPERWPSAFFDLQRLCSTSEGLIDLYLRILKVMEDDIVAFQEQVCERVRSYFPRQRKPWLDSVISDVEGSVRDKA